MNRLFLFFGLLFLQIIAFGQTSGEVKTFADTKQSSITYTMKHPLHEWTGVSKELKSVLVTNDKKDVLKQVAVTAKIASFDSQNANRDSHCIEVTEALKYPNINFVSSKIEQSGDKLNVTGTLTFHGVNQNITFSAIKKNLKGKIQVSGGFDVKMTSFKIDPPTLMGIATNDDIRIDFVALY